jgi:predicted CoA-binding protein
MPQPKQTRSWIVTTSPDRPIQEIAKDLSAAGFSVGMVNDEIQSITGNAAEDTAGKLKSVKGVVDVSPDEPIDIGPPGSPDSW